VDTAIAIRGENFTTGGNGSLDKSGLTAPGLVKTTTFKAGKSILFTSKKPLIFTDSFNMPKISLRHWLSK
jgi:hypothetical protein